MKLTEEQFDTLVSYADGFAKVRAETQMTNAELREAALDGNVEECPTCRWWVTSDELLNIDGDIDGHCDNCRTRAT